MEKTHLDLLSEWYALWLSSDLPNKLPDSLHTHTLVAISEAKLSIILSAAWRIRIEDKSGYELSPTFTSRAEAMQWVGKDANLEYVTAVCAWLHDPTRWSLIYRNGTVDEKWTIEQV